ncbi:MAG: DMT family transporter [Acidimicrobiales bacterium]
MLAVIFGALAGLSYGAADFSGAVASKKTSATVVTVAMQVVSLLALFGVLAIFPEDQRLVSDLVWAGLGGIGIAVGLTTFYQALAIGPMSTAAALTALIGSLVPLLASLALGERPGPITMGGILLSIPAVMLVSAGAADGGASGRMAAPRERVRLANEAGKTRALSVMAGLGFGAFFVALSRTSEDGGLFPLLGARGASIAVLCLMLTVTQTWEPVDKTAWKPVIVAGVLDCAANALYLTALQQGQLSWVAALTSLYPVSTVLLAWLLLKERITKVQLLGLAMAAGALSLVAYGQ